MMDYTKFSIGTKVDGGVIAVCSKCGEPGLEETVDSNVFYTHCQGFVPGTNGIFEGKWEWHMLPAKSGRLSTTV
jgi:hypothetical protein